MLFDIIFINKTYKNYQLCIFSTTIPHVNHVKFGAVVFKKINFYRNFKKYFSFNKYQYLYGNDNDRKMLLLAMQQHLKKRPVKII